MSVLSKQAKENLKLLRICRKCDVAGRSIVYWKRPRCKLCMKMTRPFELKVESNKEAVTALKKMGGDKAVIKKIVGRTADFDCPGEVTGVLEGPVITEYEFMLDRFTRINKLKNLHEDLALSLEVDSVTIRRIPGRNCIGISIPNPDREEVTYESCEEAFMKVQGDMDIPLNFGIMSDGKPYIEDLAAYPHMLIGGSTGTGKSTLINHLLVSLLKVRGPNQLRLVMIDPKTVELFPYKNIPHLMRPPVSGAWDAIALLQDIIKTMKGRTETLHNYHVNSIKDLNKQFVKDADELQKRGMHEMAEKERAKQWPYIVIVIDEMADIIIEQKKEFIASLASISQMARAAGISIIAATQRPSRDVLPGKIKVNFLANGAFRVPTATDSKTILNYKGAETLLGKGDMFITSPNASGPQRVHVAYCTREHRDPILSRIAEFGYDAKGMLKDKPKLKVVGK